MGKRGFWAACRDFCRHRDPDCCSRDDCQLRRQQPAGKRCRSPRRDGHDITTRPGSFRGCRLRCAGDAAAKIANDLPDAIARMFAAHTIPTIIAAAPNGSRPPEFRIKGEISIDDGLPSAIIDVHHVPSGNLLWTMQKTREDGDGPLFVQQLSHHVTDVIRCVKEDRERVATTPRPDILNYQFKICDLGLGQGKEELMQLINVTKTFVDLMPDSDFAHAAYGAMVAYRTMHLGPSLPEPDLQDQRTLAYKHLNRALEINPHNGRALWGLAEIHDPAVGLAEREAYSRRSLAEDPGFYYARTAMAFRLMGSGFMRDGEIHFRQFLDDRPLDRMHPANLALLLMGRGREEEARSMIEPLVNTFPDALILHGTWTYAELWYGDPDAARALIEDHVSFSHIRDCFDLFVNARKNAVRPTAEEITQTCDKKWIMPPFQYYAYFGHVEPAFAALELEKPLFAAPSSALHRRSLFEPFMKPVHDDPRFMRYMKDIGLVDFWQETNRWPDFCSRKDLPYDCETVVAGL